MLNVYEYDIYMHKCCYFVIIIIDFEALLWSVNKCRILMGFLLNLKSYRVFWSLKISGFLIVFQFYSCIGVNYYCCSDHSEGFCFELMDSKKSKQIRC